ncbi:aldehyde dehydrogenase family protein [Paenibacillus sp. 481]|uniref:aldehyde dehydrogenase family protein n=1 Tax=Paenibacillus sp. 481 TaxID=2835869 RepID=UPI001E4E65DD|nr:aldehyde dehydrogenase family protein [Paenibacillus sp. 481]UHA75407.1 aldehyde dehydrogenase family protein [Paenibacillus sp. 481]
MNFEQLTRSYINGEWVSGKGSSYTLTNPYNDADLATFPIATKAQLEEAYEAANASYNTWAANTELRTEVLMKALQYFKDHEEEIINVLAVEAGSTYIKAKVELELTIACLAEALTYVDSLGGREVPMTMPGKINKVYRKPLGVISSISPFNFPLFLSMRTIVPALALGNAVVHKGDIQTALTGGTIMAKAFEEAGIPAGVFNVILTEIPEIGDTMIVHPYSKFISFTGSTPVGRHIGQVAGGLLKPVALELGGNAPFVVLKDANIDAAINAAIFGKYLHQGQICMMINRIVLHQDIYDEFAGKFVERAKQLPIGDPLDPSVVIGPMINTRQIEKAQGFIADAKANDIEVLLDGTREGNILTPTIFGNISPDSQLAQTEFFSPIVVIIKAASDEEAIEIANHTEYGLSSSIFTSDLAKGEQLAADLEFGMTHVNDQTVNAIENTPFGGVKGSGMGRFGNPWVIDEFTETKWVSIQVEERQFPF